jgi:NarL family two-component system response regulator LiaR
VLVLLTQGLTNKQIADRLYLSINSVKTYVRNAYSKIGAANRSQAVGWAIHHGLGSSGDN